MSGTEDFAPDLAAQYVLGVLSAEEMAQVAADPAQQAAIAVWESRLAPLALLVPPLTPPGELWLRIERALPPNAAPQFVRAAVSAPTQPQPANDNAFWKISTFAALGLAAALAAIAFIPHATPSISIAALAPLASPAPAFIVTTLPNGTIRVATLTPAHVPSDRDLELWALPIGAAKPVSLGVLPASGTIIQASALTRPGGKLLVSLEPKGGSLTGQPTGPVLYGGVITKL